MHVPQVPLRMLHGSGIQIQGLACCACARTQNRMESNGVPGCIHASEASVRLLEGEPWQATGGVLAKGELSFCGRCACLGPGLPWVSCPSGVDLHVWG